MSDLVKHRKRRERDLSKAITLRPIEVYQLYGIPSSTLCQLANHPDVEKRMPSMLIPGRNGNKGLRLINHAELKRWMDKFKPAA